MPLSDAMLKQLMATFQDELEEHIGTLNKGLLALEQNPASDERDNHLTDIFRAAHSLKGAARAVNLSDIETVAHRMEDVLAIIRKEERSFTSQCIDTFLEALDTISTVMNAHVRGNRIPDLILKSALDKLDAVIIMKEEQNVLSTRDQQAGPEEAFLRDSSYRASPQKEPSMPTCEPHTISRLLTQTDASLAPYSGVSVENTENRNVAIPRPVSTTDDTIRVSTAKLDTLMDNLGELMVVRMRTEQFLDQMKEMKQRTVRWQKNLRKINTYSNRLKRSKEQKNGGDTAHILAFLEDNEKELKALTTHLDSLMGNLKNDHNYLQLVTDDLQNSIRNARMLPIATLFDIFPRMVRDLARDFGKDIVMEMTGQETEVDRHALELMKDPLIHILRNAIDHGIELPEERLSKGKPRYGTIQISAEQRGNNIVLTVSDDGCGIDLKAVRRSAVEHGLIPIEKAAALSTPETIELIFFSGLSTAKQITDISGRGVGMDVVRGNLEKMHGMIQAETAENKGTTFMLVLPLTLATSHVLLVRAAGETLALPMMNVERMLLVNIQEIKSIEGYPAVYAEGRPLPLISLARILELKGKEQSLLPDARIPVVIISVVEKRIALRVDAFLSSQQIVVKSLGSQLRRVRNIGGVTILGDGQLVTILDIADIMKSVYARSFSSMALPVITQEAHKQRVMVVDDSITTRTLEKHILENAGYEIIALVDGREAWECIYGNEKALPDLVVSDVDMPRMNGFDLAQAIKGDSHYAHIPVILVTSLDSPQDRLKGMESGADAYIVKSTFDQRELLDAIERLIK